MLVSPGTSTLTRYLPTQYISVIVGEPLGSGATGDVYRAVLGPNAKPPRGLLGTALVIKMATTTKKLFRLRHEFNIYSHLNLSGVRGVPRIFGYYQDYLTESGALIMDDVGTPLARRQTVESQVPLSEPQKYDATVSL